ncbi:MAG: LacI family DNA-binding transcriptional regulator [Cellvibrionaceae bacterium]|nr:LacI family DNA-binding transcriptional regulator [Cellvibrionaceae bacterium]
MATERPSKKKMSDIARLAGVSESTVSRALAGSKLIAKKTRDRVVAIAREQNYSINKQAQNLRLQSSKTVSVIIPVVHEPQQPVSDPFFLELLGAIADALTERNYDLLLSRVKADDWQARVSGHNYVDGLIVIGQSAIHPALDDYAKINTQPLVVWGAKLADQRYITVGADNLLGGNLATEHLIDRGRRRIVFLGDPALPEVDQRHAGYRQALAAAGIHLPEQYTVKCGFSVASGHQALEYLLNSDIEFDAIFAASDLLATIALKHLHQKHLAVPEEVSVIGFDDISLANHTMPALSTVSQNIRAGGRVLVNNLFCQMQGDDVDSQVIKPTLVVRHSS